MSKHRWLIILLIILLAVVFFTTKSILLLLFIFIAWSIVVVSGVYFIQLNFFITAENKLEKEGTVALTFDDGPHPIYTPKVLDILKEKQVKATFFLIGKNIEGNESIVAQIIAEGHQIGNHSYAHHNLSPLWSKQKIQQDIEKCQQLINQYSPTTLFYRPPFGVTNPTIANALTSLNLQPIGWSLRSYDTVAKSKEQLLHKIDKSIKSKDILLLHEAAPFTADILADMIDNIKHKGLEIVLV